MTTQNIMYKYDITEEKEFIDIKGFGRFHPLGWN